MAAHRLAMRSHGYSLLLLLTNDRERSSLRVDAKNDPEVTWDLVRTHDDVAILFLDARCRGIDIFDVEVVKP